jgi:hypothetical protein
LPLNARDARASVYIGYREISQVVSWSRIFREFLLVFDDRADFCGDLIAAIERLSPCSAGLDFMFDYQDIDDIAESVCLVVVVDAPPWPVTPT